MKPTVVGFRLLVKPIKLEEHDKAFARAKAVGLELLERTDRQEATIINSGTVVQVGPTSQFKDEVKVGDRIDYVKHGGMFVHDPDDKENKWYVINDDDVLVVWKANDE